MEKITPAVARALRAVEDGEVKRIYGGSGNILRGPDGVGSATLWKLDNWRFISDGPERSGGLVRTVVQVLTPAGRKALAGQP